MSRSETSAFAYLSSSPLHKLSPGCRWRVVFLFFLLLAASGTPLSASKPKPVALPGGCDPSRPKQHFSVDMTGSVTSTGHIYEGPLCVEVYYNPAAQFGLLQSIAGTPVAMPDFTKILLGGPAAGGGPGAALVFNLSGTDLPTAVKQLDSSADRLKQALDALKQAFQLAAQTQNAAINDLTQLNKAIRMTNEDSFPSSFRAQYKAIRADLKSALGAPASITPSDVSDPSGNVYLVDAQMLEDRLADMSLKYVTGTAKPADCVTSADVNWSDWYTKCKDSYYTPLKAKLDAILTEAQGLASTSDAAMSLKKNANIVTYWDKIFTNIGLSTGMTNDAIDKAPLVGLYTHIDIDCGAFSVQTVPNTINLVTYDYTPTLSGGDPTKAGPTGFTTVNCSTPFTISAGVGFSTIEQKTFAILQTPDGKGGTINTFGTTNDSKVTPIALAITHVRLRDWLNHRLGIYGSFGVGGNLQTDANAVYFLPGASIALWRFMYFTAGAGIGSRTGLISGYKEGDTVPTGITSISGVTKNSRTAGFGFAVTFTKP